MSERTCETCRFFVREVGADGHCRRFPFFASVSVDDWCGEHCAYDERPVTQSPATRPPETTAKCPKASVPPTSFMGVPVVMTQDEVAPPVWWMGPRADPAGETPASGPPCPNTARVSELAGGGFFAAFPDGPSEFFATRSEVAAWVKEHRERALQPVAYCIQCADDDPKVHSLSFDKAALSKIVTRHGGKVVGLYLGKP